MSNQQNNRRIFRIEVGNIPSNDIQDCIQKLKDSFKRQVPLEQQVGYSIYKHYIKKHNVYKRELLLECVPSYKRFFLKYNPLNIEEDYFIPQR
jgi:hypothetical protein